MCASAYCMDKKKYDVTEDYYWVYTYGFTLDE